MASRYVYVRDAPGLSHTSTLSYCFVVCKEKKCTVTFTSRCSWWLASPMWRQEQFLFILIVSLSGFASLFFPLAAVKLYMFQGEACTLVRFGCGLPNKVSCTRIHHAAWARWLTSMILLFFPDPSFLLLLCSFLYSFSNKPSHGHCLECMWVRRTTLCH